MYSLQDSDNYKEVYKNFTINDIYFAYYFARMNDYGVKPKRIIQGDGGIGASNYSLRASIFFLNKLLEKTLEINKENYKRYDLTEDEKKIIGKYDEKKHIELIINILNLIKGQLAYRLKKKISEKNIWKNTDTEMNKEFIIKNYNKYRKIIRDRRTKVGAYLKRIKKNNSAPKRHRFFDSNAEYQGRKKAYDNQMTKKVDVKCKEQIKGVRMEEQKSCDERIKTKITTIKNIRELKNEFRENMFDKLIDAIKYLEDIKKIINESTPNITENPYSNPVSVSGTSQTENQNSGYAQVNEPRGGGEKDQNALATTLKQFMQGKIKTNNELNTQLQANKEDLKKKKQNLMKSMNN